MRTGLPIAVACLFLAACGSPRCPPEAPCAVADGGLSIFDCGKSSCTAGQLCVVPASCSDVFDVTSAQARCVDRPEACADPHTQCSCFVQASGDSSQKVCCFYAGWQPYAFNICSFSCD
jgi:hypothetical protein